MVDDSHPAPQFCSPDWQQFSFLVYPLEDKQVYICVCFCISPLWEYTIIVVRSLSLLIYQPSVLEIILYLLEWFQIIVFQDCMVFSAIDITKFI